MDFSAVVLTEAQQAFADEVRAFLDEHLTPEVYAGIRERADHTDEGLILALGAKGWLMPQWRKEDGGAELDDVCTKILESQLIERDAPAQVGEQLPWPAVDKFADPGLRDELKPQVAHGERSVSAWATPSRTAGQTSPGPRPGRSVMATSGSSTGRRSSPPTPSTLTTCS